MPLAVVIMMVCDCVYDVCICHIIIHTRYIIIIITVQKINKCEGYKKENAWDVCGDRVLY